MNNFVNLENLNKDQKKIALEQVKYIPKNVLLDNEISNFFKENGYVKIENFLNSEILNLLYSYVKNESLRLSYIKKNNINYENFKNFYGTFDDEQALGDFSRYGSLIFDTLLENSLNQMEYFTGKNLIPTYSYHRLYTTNTDLKKHIDRPSCEISTTLCLGYDISNIDKNFYPNYNWPMFVKKNNKETPIYLNPGDMLVYKGHEIEHWREPFLGINHAQVFLHYNEKNGKFNNLYDNRPMLGVPSFLKNENKKLEDFTFTKII